MTKSSGYSSKAAPGRVVTLLSGGIDSSACLAFFRRIHLDQRALFVDYGQVAALPEERAARAIANHFGVPLSALRTEGARSKGTGLIPGRNAALLFHALMEIGEHPSLLAIGVHSGTPFFDCSAEFVRTCQSLFTEYTGGTVSIAAPFVDWSKADVFAFAKEAGVPIALTYSCEAGKDPPCRECRSCLDREALGAG